MGGNGRITTGCFFKNPQNLSFGFSAFGGSIVVTPPLKALRLTIAAREPKLFAVTLQKDGSCAMGLSFLYF